MAPDMFQSDSLLCIPFLKDFHQEETKITISNSRLPLEKPRQTVKIILDVQEGKATGIIEVPKKDKASWIIRKEKHLREWGRKKYI